MSTMDSGDRGSPRGWLLVAFALGLAIGLVLAWRVWPTRWTDTDPSDLRAAHQREYVMMVADSWTVTGNANQARERLYQLVDDKRDWAAVDALIVGVADELEQAGDVAGALRLRRMRDNVPLPIEGGAPMVPGKPERATGGSPRWALVLIGLGLVVMTIALVIWLVSNEMRKREAQYEADTGQTFVSQAPRPRTGRALSLDPIPSPGDLGLRRETTARQEGPRWDEAAFMVAAEEQDEDETLADLEEAEVLELDEEAAVEQELEWAEDELEEDTEGEQPLEARPALEPEDAWHVETAPADAHPEGEARVVDLPELEDEDLELAEAAEDTAVEAPVRPAAAGDALAVFEAVYSFGDDDFYHAFTIESPRHEFLGQCGIVISDVLGIEGAQLVDAFDIWLFETRGTRTVSKVIASEHAYTDDDLGAKLARKGELVLAQEGLLIPLQTETLRLTATIEDLAYREDQPDANSVFDRLRVRMVIEQLS